MLFGIVTRFEKLSNALLVPFRIGDGSDLYTLATGLKIILSNPWLNLNDARLKPSEQSFISAGLFFFNNSSPSEAALTFTVSVKVVIKLLQFF